TEAKVVEGLVDAIVEVTETGSTIRAHGLKIIETLLETNTKLVANHNSFADDWKRKKILQIALLLRGALNAEKLIGLKMNVPKDKMESVAKIIPSLTSPTVAQLYKSEWLSVETVIEESVAREVIPSLIEAGADGIIEYPLNKVVNRKDI
ncbi:MAG TPA: ATP phosphoribosyltransferase, partial [Spirochaetota bacterium]|nr:ATP phosphoribosyltransferase [Spirochaetota bacterium]